VSPTGGGGRHENVQAATTTGVELRDGQRIGPVGCEQVFSMELEEAGGLSVIRLALAENLSRFAFFRPYYSTITCFPW
jgi:hypothetical protein